MIIVSGRLRTDTDQWGWRSVSIPGCRGEGKGRLSTETVRWGTRNKITSKAMNLNGMGWPEDSLR